MIRKTMILGLLFVALASVSVAQEVPQLNVVPDSVDRELSAYNSHDLEFTFSNQDSSRPIYNVTLDNTSYLSWSKNKFDLNASESRTVNASFYSENITSYSDVLNSSYKYNGSDNDFAGPSIDVNVSTFYESTNVSLSTFRTDFELELEEEGQSAFTVANTGDETAFNVSLEGEDIQFERGSGFDIPPGEDVLVQYNVSIPRPESDATEATNQSYTREVSVSGENFNESGFEASVFVPFKQYDSKEEEKSLIDQVLENREALIEFCGRSENEDSLLCGNQIVEYRNNTETVYRTPEANISLTNEEILALKHLSNTTTNKYNDILSRVRLQQNTFRSELQSTRSNFSEGLGEVGNETAENREMIRSLNQSIAENNEEELQEARNRSFWMMMIFVTVLLALLVKAGFWVYENKDELTRDGGWS